MTTPQRTLLDRAARYVRLPGSPDDTPEITESGDALRCPRTGDVYPLRDGVIDLLGESFEPTDVQKIFERPVVAWIYARLRERRVLTRFFGMPDFESEVADVASGHEREANAVLLDIASGQGNFTVELAKRLGPDGLVLGVDISRAMLRLAAERTRRSGLDNILLLRGDALDLPIASRSLSNVICTGGLHQLPDLTRALQEMARVSADGARIRVSGFASARDERHPRIKEWAKRNRGVHFVPIAVLSGELKALGYRDIAEATPGGWVGWATGRLDRSAAPD